MLNRKPQKKLTIIGGGIIGAMEAYFAMLEAEKNNEPVRITIYEKNPSLSETTTYNIVPSKTPDEILSVVPRGKLLAEKLNKLFNEPGGIRVEDVEGVNNSLAAQHFIQAVEQDVDEAAHEARTEALLKFGKISMQFWEDIYNNADTELKLILDESNFKSCREPVNANPVLNDGYRIDLIYGVENAVSRAEAMMSAYLRIGYEYCRLLTPNEVVERNPFLKGFCDAHSVGNEWKYDAVALWRPGGCIDTHVFLPKFYEYLSNKLGRYLEEGKEKNCFKLKFNQQVVGVAVTVADADARVTGLRLFDGVKKIEKNKHNKSDYLESNYAFCPGEAVGTLNKLGFVEPACAGFAGPSLMLNIELPEQHRETFESFNHCMEVHQEGVVLAWQARVRNGKIFIGVAGTKAFYGVETPNIDDAFARNRNLLQLNIINDVLPEIVSLAFGGRETKGQILSQADLDYLVNNKIAKRWVGIRAAAYDGVPTLGRLYLKQQPSGQPLEVRNARTTTHKSSGGVSFAPVGVFASRRALMARETLTITTEQRRVIDEMLQYSHSCRGLRRV